MEVILLERVEKLGQIGDVVNVKAGFARNFLLPRKKALRANETNRKVFEASRAHLEAEHAKKREQATTEAKDIDGKSVTLIRQASNTGQLYGSVSVRDIAELLVAEGKKVAKNRKAHYVLLDIDAPAGVVAELERQTAINEDIIRYMTIKVDAHEAGPSAMMRRNERSDRDGRRGDRGDRPRGDREDRPRRDRDDRDAA